MSKINELIQTLCPDGVEYKKLGEVATISRGNGFQKKDFVEEGRPCIHYGQIFMHYSKIGIATSETLTCIDNDKYEKNAKALPNDIVMAVTSENVEDVCKCVVWEGDEPVAVSLHTAIFHTEMNSKFLAYWFGSSDFYVQKVRLAHGTKVIEVTPAAMVDIVLPVPPLPVQEEIVRILDEYTELEAELEAKLSEEIKLKQKQYEVYRARLLNDDSYDGYTLPEISENCDSQRKPITSSQRVSGSTPYYGASGIVDYVDDYIFDGEYLLISEDGANLLARSTPIAFSISGKTWVNNHAHILKFESYYTQKWVEYYFNSIDLSLYITGGAQPKLNQKNLNKIVIPVPSPTEQERIVKILDKYDTYTRDMISTLNTELESRKKQYAYYRDQLLTFKRKEV